MVRKVLIQKRRLCIKTLPTMAQSLFGIITFQKILKNIPNACKNVTEFAAPKFKLYNLSCHFTIFFSLINHFPNKIMNTVCNKEKFEHGFCKTKTTDSEKTWCWQLLFQHYLLS